MTTREKLYHILKYRRNDRTAILILVVAHCAKFQPYMTKYARKIKYFVIIILTQYDDIIVSNATIRLLCVLQNIEHQFETKTSNH